VCFLDVPYMMQYGSHNGCTYGCDVLNQVDLPRTSFLYKCNIVFLVV